MPRFMKMLNDISRSQAVYRSGRVPAADLQSCHYAYILVVCRMPGRSQEELARELCVNKSTAARNINYLEEKGYVTRVPLPQDKRQYSVVPTEKAKAVLPQLRAASAEWMTLLSEGISPAELDTFNAVLQRMQQKAREIIEGQEGCR